MAATIDATLSGANSNSYVTLIEADDYFDSRLYSDVWTAALDDDKNRALIMACKRINQEKFYGDRSTTTQKLPFPRASLGYLDGVLLDGIIPDALKESQYELAIHMLSVNMTLKGVSTDAYKSIKVGSIEVQPAIDSSDNASQSYSTLPPFVLSLLSDISRSASSSAFIEVSR